MDSKQKVVIALYQHLGKLFYAVALADKKIKKEEFEAMKKEISLVIEDESFVISETEVDIEHIIMSTFNVLYFEDANAEYCYNEFVDFKKTYESLFTESLKSIILKIAGKIAASFSNVNKSELMMLAKLSLELKKAPLS